MKSINDKLSLLEDRISLCQRQLTIKQRLLKEQLEYENDKIACVLQDEITSLVKTLMQYQGQLKSTYYTNHS